MKKLSFQSIFKKNIFIHLLKKDFENLKLELSLRNFAFIIQHKYYSHFIHRISVTSFDHYYYYYFFENLLISYENFVDIKDISES